VRWRLISLIECGWNNEPVMSVGKVVLGSGVQWNILVSWSTSLARFPASLPSCPPRHSSSPRLSFLNPRLIYSLATGQLTSFARFMLLILWMMLGDEFIGVIWFSARLPLSLCVFHFLRRRMGRKPSVSLLRVDRLQQHSCSAQKSQVVTGYLCIPTYF